MADDVVLIDDAVSSEHVSGLAGYLQGLEAIITLDHRDHLGGESLVVFQTRHTQHSVQPKGNFSKHVCHFLLHQLSLSEGLPELLAI